MSGMILSTECWQGVYHHLCDGWYGHELEPCECDCHTQEVVPEDERLPTLVDRALERLSIRSGSEEDRT